MNTPRSLKLIACASVVSFALFLALVLSLRAMTVPAAPVSPSSPEIIHYQGRLSRVSGAPVPATISLTFSIFDQPAGGARLWSARYDGVTVTRGVFNVMLGSAAPYTETGSFSAALFADDTRYLEVIVITSTLSPRQRIGSVAYALSARNALSATSATSAASATSATMAAQAPWSGLTGVPAQFADGIDNDTTYTPGIGLNLVGATFNVISAPVAVTATTATYAADGPFVHRLGPDSMSSGSVTPTFTIVNAAAGDTLFVSHLAGGTGAAVNALAGSGVAVRALSTGIAVSATSMGSIGVDGTALVGTGMVGVRGRYMGASAIGFGGWFSTSAGVNSAGAFGLANAGADMAGLRGEISGPSSVTPMAPPWPQNYGVHGDYDPGATGIGASMLGVLGTVRGSPAGIGTSSDGVLGVNIGPVSPPRALVIPAVGLPGLVYQYQGAPQPIPAPIESGGLGALPSEYGVRGTTTSNTEGSAGVLGETRQPNTAGVYGRCNTNPMQTGGCYGVFSDGDAFVNGNLYVTGAKVGYVIDIARNAGQEPLHTGDVVVIAGAGDPVVGDIPTPLVVKASSAYATGVMGVVEMTQDGKTTTAPGQTLKVVTLGAFKAINVDASLGAIRPGDLLVSSDHPGYAMKARMPLVDGVPIAPAGVIGKALGALDSGTGQIAVLVGVR